MATRCDGRRPEGRRTLQWRPLWGRRPEGRQTLQWRPERGARSRSRRTWKSWWLQKKTKKEETKKEHAKKEDQKRFGTRHTKTDILVTYGASKLPNEDQKGEVFRNKGMKITKSRLLKPRQFLCIPKECRRNVLPRFSLPDFHYRSSSCP